MVMKQETFSSDDFSMKVPIYSGVAAVTVNHQSEVDGSSQRSFTVKQGFGLSSNNDPAISSNW